MEKRAQQEMVGFIVIVVLVVVGLFIFMLIGFKDKKVLRDSNLANSLLSSLIKHSTECMFEEGERVNVGKLIDEAYGGTGRCVNLDKSARAYLEEYLPALMEKVLIGENNFDVYQIEIYSGETPVGRFRKGQCKGNPESGESKGLLRTRVTLTICLNGND